MKVLFTTILCLLLGLVGTVASAEKPTMEELIQKSVRESLEEHKAAILEGGQEFGYVAGDMSEVFKNAWTEVAKEEEVSEYLRDWFLDSISDVIDDFNKYGSWKSGEYEKYRGNIVSVLGEGFRMVTSKGLRREDLLAKSAEYSAFIERVKEYATDYYDGRIIHLDKSRQPSELLAFLGLVENEYGENNSNYPAARDQILSAFMDSVIQGKTPRRPVSEAMTTNLFFGGYFYGRMKTDAEAWEEVAKTFDAPPGEPVTIVFTTKGFLDARHFAVAEGAKQDAEPLSAAVSSGTFDPDSPGFVTFTYRKLSK
jgi:hypothetical protein